jgi:hypothetical protein
VVLTNENGGYHRTNKRFYYSTHYKFEFKFILALQSYMNPVIIYVFLINHLMTGACQYSDGLRAGRPGFESQHWQKCSLLHSVWTGFGAHLASYPMVTCGDFPGVRRPEREADHLPPSSAEVKNGGAWNNKNIYLCDGNLSIFVFRIYILIFLSSSHRHVFRFSV